MEIDHSSNSSNKELQRLDYTEPECWCESIGHYTNPQGQEFEIKVRGTNSDTVKEYMGALRVSFEVTPLREDIPNSMENKNQEYDMEELKSIELHPELDLEISVEIINTQGIELPYVMDAVIDPDIAKGATHNYVTQTNTSSLSVTLNATFNGVSGTLSGGKPQQADTYPPDPPRPSAFFSGSSLRPSQFRFSVTGLKDRNTYTYNPSVNLVRV